MKELDTKQFERYFNDRNLAKRCVNAMLAELCHANGAERRHGRLPVVDDGLIEQVVSPLEAILARIGASKDITLHETKAAAVGLTRTLTRSLLWRY